MPPTDTESNQKLSICKSQYFVNLEADLYGFMLFKNSRIFIFDASKGLPESLKSDN